MKITVIIPTFNRARLLSEAVDSVLLQSPNVHEIIIADDGSTDNTPALCQHLKQHSQSTKIVTTRSRKNLGAQISRNRGLSLSTGDAVMFMDSDDVLSEKGLAPLIEELKECPQLQFVYGKVVRTNQTLQPSGEIVGSAFTSASSDIAGYHWHTMGAVYRRKYLSIVGAWHEQLTGSQDWEFQSRVKVLGGEGRFIDHTVGFWRDHSESRIGTKEFRYDYVESVIKACLLIHEQAYFADKLDSSLERRLVKKILLHTLELSVNGFQRHGQSYTLQTLKLLKFNPTLRIAIYALLLTKSKADPILWNIFSS